ncbi:hypothetical protein [Nocardioides marmoriginsengisoli]|uniref:hypothetical protein n=1 Tax=Nocardioides marmoriginsengisoli TaxID=661483 RepID=UPI0011CD8545|nr:hypothetical protein [Nocardioides marmoriginsengisoli]
MTDPEPDVPASGVSPPPGEGLSASQDSKSGSNQIDMDGISAKVRRQFELVPPIGTRWRWYDIPYRVLMWAMTGSRQRVFSWRMRRRLNKALNFFSTFNHYERLKVEPLDDPMHNLIVPDGERVTQGGVWVVELFPPSRFEALRRSLERNGWDEEKAFHRSDGSNAEDVTKARRGRGFMWSRLGTVANPNSRYFAFDARREVLPPEVSLVELTAVQLGQSLTAVVAFFRLSEMGEQALNKVWTSQHEPWFKWRGLRRPDTEGRFFSGIRATQTERMRIHDLARRWLADRCGGFFASTPSGPPVIDLNLFDQFDPTAESDNRHSNHPRRALGLDGNFGHNYASPEMPGLVIVPTRSGGGPSDVLENCWGVIGSLVRVNELAEDDQGYGKKPYSPSTIGGMFDDPIRSFLLHLAILHYTADLRSNLAEARDAAMGKHRKFSAKRIDHLRSELLTTSLDLPVVARDSMTLWEDQWRRLDGVEVRGVPVPGHTHPHEDFDLIDGLKDACNQAFEELLAEDAAYREVLSTVASLGASADASRFGRRALIVAGASLVVALATVLVANTGDHTLWSDLIKWVKH